MMGALFKKLAGDGLKKFRTYAGDTVFLAGAASAAANMTAADGSIEEAEIKKAKRVMGDNPIIKASFSQSDIEKALNEALDRAETRSGRGENAKAIAKLVDRDQEDREAVFLIALDVADIGDIGEKEDRALTTLADALKVNKNALLAA